MSTIPRYLKVIVFNFCTIEDSSCHARSSTHLSYSPGEFYFFPGRKIWRSEIKENQGWQGSSQVSHSRSLVTLPICFKWRKIIPWGESGLSAICCQIWLWLFRIFHSDTVKVYGTSRTVPKNDPSVLKIFTQLLDFPYTNSVFAIRTVNFYNCGTGCFAIWKQKI